MVFDRVDLPQPNSPTSPTRLAAQDVERDAVDGGEFPARSPVVRADLAQRQYRRIGEELIIGYDGIARLLFVSFVERNLIVSARRARDFIAPKMCSTRHRVLDFSRLLAFCPSVSGRFRAPFSQSFGSYPRARNASAG
jgi:hypothetical protein